MQLKDILQGVEYTLLQGDISQQILGISYDSRKVCAGELFVCIGGFRTDGHRYATGAVEKGAKAILVEHPLENMPPEEITVVKTADNRAALAQVSANFYGRPSEALQVVGITGTNGKTTTTYLIRSVLERLGKTVGLIGTIENRIGKQVLPAERTTPESKELQELFVQMRQANATHVVMEVSSHSLSLHRVDGVDFDIGVFTNLTQDHLDYHGTMEAYREAKGLLFRRCKKSVINLDDAAGEYMCQQAAGEVLGYAIDREAPLRAKEVRIDASGTSFVLEYGGKSFPLHLHTPGRFSVYNALAAIGVCIYLQIPLEDILAGIEENPGVTGRFQSIQAKDGRTAIVDYAHTPDGLENILKTAKEFAKGRIIAVFGCGGDRDKTKRPIMGRIGGSYADLCILTSDNPRTEDPLAILKEVEAGVMQTDCPYQVIADRKEAIDTAVKMAKKEDVVLIAGKGHETYQIFADHTIHFDDAEEVKRAFGEE